MFDLGFGVEVDAEEEASGVMGGRGVRRRVWRVRPLRAMRVGIIFGRWMGMQQTADSKTIQDANFLIPFWFRRVQGVTSIGPLMQF